MEEINEKLEIEENESFAEKIPIQERLRVEKLPYKLPQKLIQILEGFKWAIHFKKQSAVMIVDGRSGMGKTTLSFQIAKYMTEDFSLDKVFFTPEAFIKGLSEAQKGDVLVFDEAMLLSSRAALSAINRMIVIAMSMIRSRNLLIIFNVNSIFDLDKNLALSRADLLLNCYGESLTDKGKFLAFFKGSDGMDRIKSLYINGKKYYSYAKPKANFYTTFSSYFVLDEAEYEKRKQVGVDKFLTGGKLEKESKGVKSRNELIYKLYESGEYTQKQLAKMSNLAEKTIWEIIDNAKKKKMLETNPEFIEMKKKIEEKIKLQAQMDSITEIIDEIPG